MKTNELIATTPISVEKSVRGDELRSITSCQPGVIVPLAYVPLLREDRVSRGSVTIALDMMETLYPLLNSVNVTCYAHLIPFLCFDRFQGMDELNRSYQGIPEAHNSTVIPFFTTEEYDGEAPFWRALGMYWPEGGPINAAPLEAYNFLVNWRRRARTDKLPQRLWNDTTLAEAFWKNTNMNHVVPDFDPAMIDGEVELQFATDKMYIKGIGRLGPGDPLTPTPGVSVYNAGYPGGQTTYPYAMVTDTPQFRFQTTQHGTPDIFAELADTGVKLSLANIELARQTAAFAKLREKYDGLDDDHIIDLLMEGIRVPDAAMKQPILLDRKSTIFGMTERHAMDGESLDMSLTTGKTRLGLTFRTPPINTGGIILITCEIVPEQLYERQQDKFLATTDPALLPNFMRDYLDPQKVEVVPNEFVDVLHTVPNGIFGYAPLNHAWRRSLTRTGGKFTRPFPDTFVEERQRFWSVDQIDPTLTDDFYMVGDLPNSVFADTVSDPFEVLTLGGVSIVGNTVFGDKLEEDTGSYDAIMEQVDTSRITPAE